MVVVARVLDFRVVAVIMGPHLMEAVALGPHHLQEVAVRIAPHRRAVVLLRMAVPHECPAVVRRIVVRHRIVVALVRL